MVLKSKKGSIAMFVFIAVVFFSTTLLLLYGVNMNGMQTVDEKSKILKNTYEKNTNNESIDDLYRKLSDKNGIDSNTLYKTDRVLLDGTNAINTGVQLFSQANIDKDFEISFEIVKGNIGSVIQDSRYLSILGYNTGLEGNVGIELYCKDGLYEIKLKWGSRKYTMTYSSTPVYLTSEENPIRVKIRRVGNVLFIYLNDDGTEVKAIDYSNYKVTFDSPLILGGKMDENGDITNISKVEYRNIEIKYIDDYKSNYTETKMANYYKLDGIVRFDGTNYIDTGISLFSEENIAKNFEISFNLVITQNNTNGTLLECKDNSQESFTGIKITNTDSKHKLSVNSRNREYSKDLLRFKIYSLYGNVYCEGDTNPYPILIKSPFNSNLIFGASLNSSGNASDYYYGIVSDIEVKIKDKEFKKAYELVGPKAFNGSSCDNTGVKLFSEENVKKDFEISFDIVSVGSYTDKATLMSSMYEAGQPYQGFVFRINTSQKKFEIRGGANGNSSTYTPYPEQDTTKNVKIIRENQIIYYSIDGGSRVKIGDFTNVTTFDYPVTFGAGLSSNINVAQRYFTGTLSNMKILLEDYGDTD